MSMETVYRTEDGAVVLRSQDSKKAPAVLIVKDADNNAAAFNVVTYGLSSLQALELARCLLSLVKP